MNFKNQKDDVRNRLIRDNGSEAIIKLQIKTIYNSTSIIFLSSNILLLPYVYTKFSSSEFFAIVSGDELENCLMRFRFCSDQILSKEKNSRKKI